MDRDTVKFIVVFILTVISAGGFVAGAIETAVKRDEGANGCAYESIASFNPGRAIGCEIFRKRWGK